MSNTTNIKVSVPKSAVSYSKSTGRLKIDFLQLFSSAIQAPKAFEKEEDMGDINLRLQFITFSGQIARSLASFEGVAKLNSESPVAVRSTIEQKIKQMLKRGTLRPLQAA